MIKLLKKIKRALKNSQNYIQKAIAKNINHLYHQSPYNKLMAELDGKADFEKYQPYSLYRKEFEQKIRELSRWFAYFKLHGTLYHLNRSKEGLKFREAFINYTGLNSRMRFSLEILEKYFTNAKEVYLTEHDTNYHKSLQSLGKYNLTTSIYKHGDELHQDMTGLTYADNSFDLCMSFEDLEHIPDYQAVIKELYRVTKPGGHVLLSAPFILENDHTLVRATTNSAGEIIHLLPPEYHGDPVLPQGILCYYYFGWDLLDVFRDAGFSSVKVVTGYDIDKMILDTLLFIVAEK
jgi:SAM-dependent methyltransferase